jgi:DNA-binding XRE family transcriptional regulator
VRLLGPLNSPKHRAASVPARVPKGARNLARSYNFVDKHEAIDELRTLMADAGMSVDGAARKAGVRPQTIYLWLNGKTRRAANADA